MVGVDTNVLVRFLTGDDAAQTARVDELLADADSRGERLHVDSVVLCELVWVLRSVFRLPRETIGELLERLMHSRQFVVADREATQAALDAYRRGPADFSDYLIGERNQRAGCQDTVSFDQALDDSPLFRVL